MVTIIVHRLLGRSFKCGGFAVVVMTEGVGLLEVVVAAVVVVVVVVVAVLLTVVVEPAVLESVAMKELAVLLVVLLVESEDAVVTSDCAFATLEDGALLTLGLGDGGSVVVVLLRDRKSVV